MALSRDVSERERDRQRIEYLSGHDELTELPNCRFFTTQVDAAVDRAGRSGRQVAVLHVDLNRFSLVNQGLGLAGGDELLRQTAGRLREARSTDGSRGSLLGRRVLLLASDLPPEQPGAGGLPGRAGGSGGRARDRRRDPCRPGHPFEVDGSKSTSTPRSASASTRWTPRARPARSPRLRVRGARTLAGPQGHRASRRLSLAENLGLTGSCARAAGRRFTGIGAAVGRASPSTSRRRSCGRPTSSNAFRRRSRRPVSTQGR